MTSSIFMMDITAKIKETIIEIQNTKTKQNIKFANKLENCLLLFNASKSKSKKVKKEDILISSNVEALCKRNDCHDQRTEFKDPNMVKTLDQFSVPENLEEFNNRDDGFEHWEEFEDQKDPAPSTIESISCNDQKRYVAPSNLEAFNSRDNSLDVWTDFVDREIILKGEIVEKKETWLGDVDKQPNQKYSTEGKTFFHSNHEEFNDRDPGLEQWAEFDCQDKAYNHILDRSKVKNENCMKFGVNEAFESGLDENIALKTLNENEFCDKSVDYNDKSKKVQEVENEHSGKTEISTGDDKHKTITVKAKENTFPSSSNEVVNKKCDGLDQLEEMAVNNVKEANRTDFEEYSTSTIDLQSKLLKCKFCALVIKDGKHKNGELRNHMRKAHFVCCICEYKSDNKIEAESHFAKQHEEENGYLRCNIGGCDFRENRTARLNQLVHNDRQLYTMASGLRTHIRSIHQDIWFQCDQCPIKKSLARDLKEHKQTHAILQEARTRNQCTICGIRLLGTRGGNLSRHMKLIHGDRPSLFTNSFAQHVNSLLKISIT